MIEVFPFTIRSNDNWLPYEYLETFRANKPKDLTWFKFDVVVKSRNDIEFIAFDMLNTYYGGKGKEIARFSVTVPGSVTHDSIENRLFDLAREKRAQDLRKAEEAEIRHIANTIRIAMDQSE